MSALLRVRILSPAPYVLARSLASHQFYSISFIHACVCERDSFSLLAAAAASSSRVRLAPQQHVFSQIVCVCV
jgi:hypothetical protein